MVFFYFSTKTRITHTQPCLFWWQFTVCFSCVRRVIRNDDITFPPKWFWLTYFYLKQNCPFERNQMYLGQSNYTASNYVTHCADKAPKILARIRRGGSVARRWSFPYGNVMWIWQVSRTIPWFYQSSVVGVCSHTGFQGEFGISATRKRKFEATRSIKNSLLPSPVARRWRFTFYVARSVHVKVHASNIVFFKSTQNTGHRCHHILQNANDFNAQTDTYRTKQIEKE